MIDKNEECSSPVFAASFEGNRDYQEDFYAVSSHHNQTLLVISDGMGGHSSGDVASRMVVQSLTENFIKYREFEIIIHRGIEEAREKMLDYGKNMGATVVVAMVDKKNSHYNVILTWIGDSRIYAVTSPGRVLPNAREIGISPDNKKLWLLTEDDSIIWSFFLKNELTLDELTQHPIKNQLDYSVHPDKFQAPIKAVSRIRRFTLEQDDILLLCSDGVWESFPKQLDIPKYLLPHTIENSLPSYLKNAIETGMCSDNATFIIAKMNDDLFHQNCSASEPEIDDTLPDKKIFKHIFSSNQKK